MRGLEGVRIAVWTATGGSLASVEQSLHRMGCQVYRVHTFEHLWDLMENDLDLIIAGCQSAPEVLLWMKGVRLAGSAAPPVLTLATAMDMKKYLAAMEYGAFDCVALPVQESELRRLVSRALEERRAEPLLLPG